MSERGYPKYRVMNDRLIRFDAGGGVAEAVVRSDGSVGHFVTVADAGRDAGEPDWRGQKAQMIPTPEPQGGERREWIIWICPAHPDEPLGTRLDEEGMCSLCIPPGPKMERVVVTPATDSEGELRERAERAERERIYPRLAAKIKREVR